MNLQEIRIKLERKKGQKEQILTSTTKVKDIIKGLEKDIIISEKARTIMQIVAQETQQELEYRLSEMVSLCLKSVFPNPYELVVKFVTRREKAECDLLFKRHDLLRKPKEASGIGSVDVGAFGLRIASWSLSKPRTRPLLLLDEPFKHLKGIDANIKVIQMVKALSKKLGLQIVMISDERVPMEEIEKGADKIFKVTMKNDISSIAVYKTKESSME